MKKRSLAGLVLVLAVAAPGAADAAVKTSIASISSSGTRADGGSGNVAISPNGRFVVFQSQATNLVRHDTNGMTDIFLRDRRTGKTVRVSLTWNGSQADGSSYDPEVSSDGRFVVFRSDAENLVKLDENNRTDVFVRDRKLRATYRVSVSSSGEEAEEASDHPSISANGRFVVFDSAAKNLVGNDTDTHQDVFIRDRKNKTTRRITVDTDGESFACEGYGRAISLDGTVVAFGSSATTLVPNDTLGMTDVFVWNRLTKKIRRATVRWNGAESDHSAGYCSLAGTGNRVAWESDDEELVKNDSNMVTDVFVRDLRLKRTIRASVRAGGGSPNGWHGYAGISPDGRFVSFQGADSNIVPGDTNGSDDVFVRDLRAHITKRISRSRQTRPNGSGYAWISAGGRFVVFESDQTDHGPHDGNTFVDAYVRGPFRWPR